MLLTPLFQKRLLASAIVSAAPEPEPEPEPEPQASSWIGVPDPAVSFGYDPLTVTEPADHANWPSAEATGQYYIDSGHISATDSGNTYGYPDQPRATIPDDITFSAGDKMVIVGDGEQYATGGDGRWQFGANGTSGNPVWIVSRGSTNPKLQDEVRLGAVNACTHLIIDGIEFNTDRQSLNISGNTTSSYIVYRNAHSVGPGTASGNTAFFGMSGADHVVAYNLEISDWGDYQNASENDYHALLPGVNCSYVWVLNCHCYRNGGDSIQVGQANLAAGTFPNHIYIAGNTFHGDRENGVDVKDADNVVISQNEIYDYSVVSSSNGEGIVIHDEANGIWCIANKIYNTNIGIYASSEGNINALYNEIRDLNGTVDTGGPYYEPNTAIFINGVVDLCASYNTIHNASIGIQIATGVSGTIEAVGNVFGQRNLAGGWDIMIESTSDSAAATFEGNHYYDTRGPRMRVASTDYTSLSAWQAATPHDDNGVENTVPEFTDEAGDDFTLSVLSPAVDAGIQKPSVLADYLTTFGVAIEVDRDGNARPSDATDWDAGAYERTGSAAQHDDTFGGSGSLTGYTTYLGNDSGGDLDDADIEVTQTSGRYRAHLKDNSSNQTLWFNSSQGRADGILISGDFEAIAYNIGIGTVADSQAAPTGSSSTILFCGLNVHSSTQSAQNYAHLVAGHRNGDATYTVEGKNTISGSSSVNDIGDDAAPDCRVDMRVVRSGSTLSWYYRLPGDSTWISYTMPGSQFTLTSSVYVNLITYAQNSTGVPFVGTCDRFVII